MWYGSGVMETVTIYLYTPGLEVSADNRLELAQTIDDALKESGGQWIGCRYTKETIAIHALVEEKEQARSLIISAIKDHLIFSRMWSKNNLFANIT